MHFKFLRNYFILDLVKFLKRIHQFAINNSQNLLKSALDKLSNQILSSYIHIASYQLFVVFKSIIYLNAGFTISPCLSFFNVLFLNV